MNENTAEHEPNPGFYKRFLSEQEAKGLKRAINTYAIQLDDLANEAELPRERLEKILNCEVSIGFQEANNLLYAIGNRGYPIASSDSEIEFLWNITDSGRREEG